MYIVHICMPSADSFDIETLWKIEMPNAYAEDASGHGKGMVVR